MGYSGAYDNHLLIISLVRRCICLLSTPFLQAKPIKLVETLQGCGFISELEEIQHDEEESRLFWLNNFASVKVHGTCLVSENAEYPLAYLSKHL